jgi:SAM-dependent methyltransferase
VSGSDSPRSRDDWARRAAAWERTSKESGTSSTGYNDALIEGAGVAPGQRVLDLAAGMGDPTIAIAQRVGATGHVVALDQSPEMLAGGRRRATADDLSNIGFASGDMMALPFADAAFDAVTCRNGLMFPADRIAAAAEARRVARPGARAAFLVWGEYRNNTVFAVVREATLAYFGLPGAETAPLRHVFAPEGALAATLTDAGFEDVEERPITTSSVISGDGSAWRNQLERSYSDRLEQLDGAQRKALDDAIREAFAPHREGDGFRVNTHAKIGTGRAP